MSDLEDFPEGDSSSADADAPGVVPADDAPDRAAPAKQGGFDSASVSDAPVMRRSTKTQHTQDARKAFAAAVLANKAKPPTPPTGAAAELADLDPEAASADTAPIAAKADVAKAKVTGADIIAAPPPVAAPPPAPSLDPEVRRLREQAAAERKALADERAEFEKTRAAAAKPVVAEPVAMGLEEYVDQAPRAFRSWLESMRGEPMTDDEFKAEISDFITQSSAEVLGVPLPEATRVRLEAALARKAVRTSKTIQTKREAAAAAKAEADRKAHEERTTAEQVEREFARAAELIGQQFAPTKDATGAATQSQAAATYPWLAAEDEPGKIIVDVIRAAANRDGTQMSWQEASKKANDFLEAQAKGYVEKRKALLGTPAAPKPMAAVMPAPAAAAQPAAPVDRQPTAPQKWTRDKHVESTKAAFRKAIAGQG